MDGYHLRRASLSPAGLARRGAPWTFDAAAFVAALSTLRTTGQLLDAPSFDHRLGDPVRGGASIGPDVVAVIVEGNYLLIEDATDVEGVDEPASGTLTNSGPGVAEQVVAAAPDAQQRVKAQPMSPPPRTAAPRGASGHPSGATPPSRPTPPTPPAAPPRPPPTVRPAAAAPLAAAAASATRPTLSTAEAAGAGGDGRVWASVKPLLDEVWYLDTPPPVALRRVAGRHRRVAGLSRPAAAARVAANDARNAAMVSRGRGRADVVWTPGQGVTVLCQPGEPGA